LKIIQREKIISITHQLETQDSGP